MNFYTIFEYSMLHDSTTPWYVYDNVELDMKLQLIIFGVYKETNFAHSMLM